MNYDAVKERFENNAKTLSKIEELVNHAVSTGLDIYRVIAMYVFDCTYDDDNARSKIKKFMIPGSDKSFMPISEYKETVKIIEEKFPFILDCDIYEDDISASCREDATMESLYLILPMYKFKSWDEFNHKRLNELND